MAQQAKALQNILSGLEEYQMEAAATTTTQQTRYNNTNVVQSYNIRSRTGQFEEYQMENSSNSTNNIRTIQLQRAAPITSNTSVNNNNPTLNSSRGMSSEQLKQLGGMTDLEKSALWAKSNLSPNNATIKLLLNEGDPLRDLADPQDMPVYAPSALGKLINLPSQESLQSMQQDAKTRREKELVSAKIYQTNLLAKLRDSNPTGVIILKGVKALSLRRYHSRVYQVLKAGYPVSLYGLAGFLATHNRTYAHGSLDAWACSINLFSSFLERETTDAEKDYWHRFKKGMKVCTPEGVAKVKGAITRTMVDDIIERRSSRRTNERSNEFLKTFVMG
jgi:hypothetical protein